MRRYPYLSAWQTLAKARAKEADITQNRAKLTSRAREHIRHGFVYERVPHITLKSIANNAEIDVIWDHWRETAGRAPVREAKCRAQDDLAGVGDPPRASSLKVAGCGVKTLLADWWGSRVARQQEIDKSIAAKAEFEFLYDKPYDDKKKGSRRRPHSRSRACHRIA